MGLVPELSVDDGLLLALVDLVFVGDLSQVLVVVEKRVDLRLVPTRAASGIAEIGASYLFGHTSIENQIDNSAGYLAGWLGRLRGDNRLVVHAAAQAQKAADWILGDFGTEAVAEANER